MKAYYTNNTMFPYALEFSTGDRQFFAELIDMITHINKYKALGFVYIGKFAL